MSSTYQSVLALLRDPGEPFEFGGDESDSREFIATSRAKYPDKKYCLVRDWVVWDIQASVCELRMLEAGSYKPMVLHAKFVINDETGRLKRGQYHVSASPLEMSEPCFFVTNSTVFILTGKGTRKNANSKDVQAIRSKGKVFK